MRKRQITDAVVRITEVPTTTSTAPPTTTTAPPPPEDPELSNARESARSYLDLMAFSRQGLIDQLSSEYGDQFTREQAEHGATAALG